MSKNILIAVVAIGVLLLIASLSTAKPNTDTTNPSTEDPTNIIADQSMPAVPQYPNATMVSSKETSRDTSKIHYAFILESSDSISDINEWYREALSSGDWSIKSDRNIGGYQLIQGESERFYTSMQASNAEAGKVRISQQATVKIQ